MPVGHAVMARMRGDDSVVLMVLIKRQSFALAQEPVRLFSADLVSRALRATLAPHDNPALPLQGLERVARLPGTELGAFRDLVKA